jgi:hypothetical protein
MATTSAAVRGFTAVGVALFTELAIIASEMIKAMAFKIPPPKADVDLVYSPQSASISFSGL